MCCLFGLIFTGSIHIILNTFCGLTHIKREITNINYQIKTNLSRFLETKQKSKRFCQLNMKNVIAVHGKL